MNVLLLVNAGLLAAICAIHVFVGSRTDVRPLLASDLPEPAKSTVYYSWHMVSITIAGLSLAFLLTGLFPFERAPAELATVLCTAFAVLGFAFAGLRRKSPVTELPQGLMFAVVAAIGIWSLAQ